MIASSISKLQSYRQVHGTDYKTPDGTCIWDYIDVTDLVDAHVKALAKATPGHVGIYNVGTGRGTYLNLLPFSVFLIIFNPTSP